MRHTAHHQEPKTALAASGFAYVEGCWTHSYWTLDRFSKNSQKSNFMKIRSIGAELFHADGQTIMTKLTFAFRNFANVPTKTFTITVTCT